MPFETNHVVNTLLQRAFNESRSDMTPMKVQKMLSYTHGWHLATTGRPAIDKSFEVWPYGPVVDKVYRELKFYGSSPVSNYIREKKPDGSEIAYVVNEVYTDLYQSVDVAWEKYIGISAVRLSAMTHEPGSPWDLAKRQGMGTIPDMRIKDYFVRLAGG